MSATLVLRNVKGSALTTLELDNNFSNLNTFTTTVNANVGLLGQLTTSGNTSNLVVAVNHINADSGVVASTYGNNLIIPSIVVNSKGRITSASNSTILSTLASTNPFHPNVKFTGNITETSVFITTSAISATNGTILTRHLSGTTAFTDNLTDGQSVTMLLHNGSTYAVTWPGMTWISSSGNTAPTLSNRAGFTFFKQGSNLFGIYLGSYL